MNIYIILDSKPENENFYIIFLAMRGEEDVKSCINMRAFNWR